MKRRVLIALTGALVFYALSDILLWQRIFETHRLYQFNDQYQTGHVAALVALIGVGMVLLIDAKLWALWYGLALYTLGYGGVADVLYYLLDWKPIPATLPWLDQNALILFKPVTQLALWLSTIVWLTFWTATLLFLPAAWSRLLDWTRFWRAETRARSREGLTLAQFESARLDAGIVGDQQGADIRRSPFVHRQDHTRLDPVLDYPPGDMP
jgi:hypothetical protein